jgi:hypothetical protein
MTTIGGKIGGWTINNPGLEYKTDNLWTFLYPGGLDNMYCTDGNYRKLEIGVGTPDSIQFGVTNEGELYASAGQIGGWTIGDNSLKNGTLGASGSAFVCTGTKSSLTLGGHTGTGWVFGAGSNFGVTNTGDIYATSGQIGKWNITGAGLSSSYGKTTSGYEDNLVGIWRYGAHKMDSEAAYLAMTAGGHSGGIGVAPFRVYYDGSLVCTRATITGIIKASTIDANCYLQDGARLGSDKNLIIENYFGGVTLKNLLTSDNNN